MKLKSKIIGTVLFIMMLCILPTRSVKAEVFGDYEYQVMEDGSVEITLYTGNAQDITIPSSIDGKKVTSIGYGAFWESNMQTLVIPNTVTKLNGSCIFRCRQLQSVSIPASVTVIGNNVFSQCCRLKNLSVNSNNKVYDSRDNCNALIHSATNTLLVGCTDTIIPDTVEAIGDAAFSDRTELNNIVIPKSVKKIGDFAFSTCYNLESVTLPDSLEAIGNRTFQHCYQLKKVTIPATVTKIGIGVFGECKNLETIVVDKGNQTFDSRENCNAIIHTATNKLISSCKNTFIPDTVTIIGEDAFADNAGVTQITLPAGLKRIEAGAFFHCNAFTKLEIPGKVTYIGEGAFAVNDSITDVYIPASVEEFGGNVFEGCSNLIRAQVASANIGEDAFWNCKMLESITLHEGVETIGMSAFCNCIQLTSVVLPTTLTRMDYSAFWGCSNLSSVTIPPSVKEFGSSIFNKCPNLTIYGVSGSPAEAYAKKEGIPFSPIHIHKYTSKIVPANVDTKRNGYVLLTCTSCGEKKKTTTITCPTKFTLSEKQFVYDGTTKTPTVTVAIASGKVVSSRHYSITWDTGRKKIGKYKCKIVFNGEKYKGTKELTFTIIPKATEINSVANATSGIIVKWSRNSQASGVKILRSYDGKVFNVIKTIRDKDTISYTDETATKDGRVYYYKIIAYNTESGETINSKISLPKVICRLQRPVLDSVSEYHSDRLRLRWKDSSASSGYLFQVAEDPGFKNITMMGENGRFIINRDIYLYKSNVQNKYIRYRTYSHSCGEKSFSAWSSPVFIGK